MTETATRPCEAQNPLTCKFHGVPEDLSAVPQFVEDNIARLQMLSDIANETYNELYLLEPVHALRAKNTTVEEYLTDYAGAILEPELQEEYALISRRYLDYKEANDNYHAELDVQDEDADDYVATLVKEKFPNFSAADQKLLVEHSSVYFAFNQSNNQADHDHLLELINRSGVKEELNYLTKAHKLARTGIILDDNDLQTIANARMFAANRKLTVSEIAIVEATLSTDRIVDADDAAGDIEDETDDDWYYDEPENEGTF